MLSDNLRTLQGHLLECRDTGMELDAPAVVAVCAILEAAIYDAEQLEARPVPPVDRLAELPPNVVRLARVLDRKGVRVGPRPTGGGDAA